MACEILARNDGRQREDSGSYTWVPVFVESEGKIVQRSNCEGECMEGGLSKGKVCWHLCDILVYEPSYNNNNRWRILRLSASTSGGC